MKLHYKIIIDRFIGLPLVYGLNVLARLLGFLLRIDHSLDKAPATIAICKFVGLGSIIQATPLIKTLRKNYPNARIVFVTSTSNKTLFSHINEVDEVLTVSDKKLGALLLSSVQLLFKLWKQRPDIYIDLEIYSNYSSVISTLSISKNRMGFFKNDKTYRKGMYTHMLFFNIKAPISQVYLQFARLIGCNDSVETLSIEYKNNLSAVEQKLQYSLKNYIVINPNASDLRLERRWPLEHFVTLIKKINTELPEHTIILIGSKDENPYVSEISEKIDTENCINSAGKLSISELITLIANARLMVTNDTGPMHIAFAVKTKTVALFGPCSPQQYGGAENSITHYKNTYCSPCVHEFIIPPCKGDNQCMKKITVDEVFNSIKIQLSSTAISNNNNTAIDYTNGTVPLGVVVRQ